ncbi:hypothetical protein J2T22_000620 [Pseudarthrobacter defluvii]|uniref:Uncharacterized protein n=1 Tax=Pseudarthrobacter defluvii TaxID=410837 RepID=A0ABT9UCS6_9MICC|nr:hypothetical protein [Pseudarthrobacter defluvii]MDQ0117450.1 hypothetical protein [Pseudarthrobacter defluvii]
MTSSKLSNADLVNLCEIFKAKAIEEHDLFRAWQARAIEAETRLAIYEPGDPPAVDARAWMNRALLAEAQLATLRAAYEPTNHQEK